MCRKSLAVEHKMLQEPPEKANFLTTTLRRQAHTQTHTYHYNRPTNTHSYTLMHYTLFEPVLVSSGTIVLDWRD